MTARRTPRRRRVAARARARQARARVRGSIQRIEGELPPTLAQFSRRVRARLRQLEARIGKAGALYRTRGARLLRDASHQLGRFEAEGEARWRRLTSLARRDALKVLRRLEKEVAPPRRRRRAKPRAVARAVKPEITTGGI